VKVETIAVCQHVAKLFD